MTITLAQIIIAVITVIYTITVSIIGYTIKRILTDIETNSKNVNELIINQNNAAKDITHIQAELKNKIDNDNFQLMLKNIDLKFDNIINIIKQNNDK